MGFTFVILLSIALTGVIVYGIYYFTRTPEQHKSRMKSIVDEHVQSNDDFLEEIEVGFEETVSTEIKPSNSEKPEKVYPDCFGSTGRYKSCERDCSVSNECASTVKMLEGF